MNNFYFNFYLCVKVIKNMALPQRKTFKVMIFVCVFVRFSHKIDLNTDNCGQLRF